MKSLWNDQAAASLTNDDLGKVAIITRAAEGIGAATAKQLHADGAVVVGLDIKSAVSDELNAPGLSGVQCDLADEDAVKEAIDQVVVSTVVNSTFSATTSAKIPVDRENDRIL